MKNARIKICCCFVLILLLLFSCCCRVLGVSLYYHDVSFNVKFVRSYCYYFIFERVSNTVLFFTLSFQYSNNDFFFFFLFIVWSSCCCFSYSLIVCSVFVSYFCLLVFISFCSFDFFFVGACVWVRESFSFVFCSHRTQSNRTNSPY